MKVVYEATGKTVDEAIDAARAQSGVSLDEAEIEVLEFGSRGFFGIGGKEAKVRFTVHRPDEKPEPKAAKVPGEEPKKAESSPAQAAPSEENREKKEGRSPKVARGEKSSRPREARPVKGQGLGSNRPVRPASPPIAYNEEQVAQFQGEVLAFLQPIFEKLQVQPEHTWEFAEGVLSFSFSGRNLGSLIGRRGETLNALQYLSNLVVNRRHGAHIRIVLDVEGYRLGREETLMNLARKMAEKAVRTGRRVELEPMNPNERRMVHLALQEDKRVDTQSKGEEPYRRVIISCKRNSRNR